MLWERRYSRKEFVQLQKSPWGYHFSLQSLTMDNLRLGKQEECRTSSSHFGWPIILVISCQGIYFESSGLKLLHQKCTPGCLFFVLSHFLLMKLCIFVTQVTIFCLSVCSYSQESNLLPLSRVLCLCISTNFATLLLSIMQQFRTESSFSLQQAQGL